MARQLERPGRHSGSADGGVRARPGAHGLEAAGIRRFGLARRQACRGTVFRRPLQNRSADPLAPGSRNDSADAAGTGRGAKHPRRKRISRAGRLRGSGGMHPGRKAHNPARPRALPHQPRPSAFLRWKRRLPDRLCGSAFPQRRPHGARPGPRRPRRGVRIFRPAEAERRRRSLRQLLVPFRPLRRARLRTRCPACDRTAVVRIRRLPVRPQSCLEKPGTPRPRTNLRNGLAHGALLRP